MIEAELFRFREKAPSAVVNHSLMHCQFPLDMGEVFKKTRLPVGPLNPALFI